MEMLIFIIMSWLVTGLFTAFICIFLDLRGKELDENYLKKYRGMLSFLILSGYVGFIVIGIAAICNYIGNIIERKKISKKLTKFLYKIANVGVKNNKKGE